MLPAPRETPPWETATIARRCRSRRSSSSSIHRIADTLRRRDLRTRVVPAGRPLLDAVARADRADPRRVHVRSEGDDRGHTAGRGLRLATRRVSGLRTPRDRVLTLARHSRALRQRLLGNGSAAEHSAPDRRRRLTRMAGLPLSWCRLDSGRSDATMCCRRIATSRWPGAATTPTSARFAASSSAAARTRSGCTWMSFGWRGRIAGRRSQVAGRGSRVPPNCEWRTANRAPGPSHE